MMGRILPLGIDMAATVDQLLEGFSSYERETALAEIAAPQWERLAPCNDWKRYIPEQVRQAWSSLSDESRLAAFATADARASAEP
jgi:hypothetical protein